MSLTEDLQKFQLKRKFPDWQPLKPNVGYKGDKKSTSYEVLLRCLVFLPLELQVQTWNTEAMLMPELEEIANVLARNSADENKHDKILIYLSDYLGSAHDSAKGRALIERWQALNCHPVISTYALEMGVFFSILPTLTKFGDVYCANVSQWINDDERVHVETGLRLMKAMGLKLTTAVVQLVYDTNVFIYEPLGAEEAASKGSRAIHRLVSTRDPEMLRESLPTTIAFFEQRHKQSIVY